MIIAEVVRMCWNRWGVLTSLQVHPNPPGASLECRECQAVRYCSERCQQSRLASHRLVCQSLKEELVDQVSTPFGCPSLNKCLSVFWVLPNVHLFVCIHLTICLKLCLSICQPVYQFVYSVCVLQSLTLGLFAGGGVPAVACHTWPPDPEGARGPCEGLGGLVQQSHSIKW